MSNELSYLEALHGLVHDEDMEAMIGLIDSHKSWGAFRAKIPTYLLINLVDEVKRLRQIVGGFKVVPDLEAMDRAELDLMPDSDE
jgi:hypothetical protein